MIVRETSQSFYMTLQHDHAFLSGEIVKHFARNSLLSQEAFADVQQAAYEHDRGWIGLDDTPIWNDRSGEPYDFSDYPLLPKLAFYRIGLDEIEKSSAYAGLLCSMHFCSFFARSTDRNCLAFVQEERKRQDRIKRMITEVNEELLLQHFHLLQFSDNLSLYLCLNDPGVSKEAEHPWFQKGFKNTESLHPRNQPLMPRWLNRNEVTIEPFPFEKEFHLCLKYKKISKRNIEEIGIVEAFQKSEVRDHTIFIKRFGSKA
ncbi:DUF3891 family protein [Rossellomorea vietnamensis]|uniref:DUF3891 family protein n=1 Tax=Rossellomorea vietnamensis TaxID=218284 RepID=A0A5D4MCN7_9BACI|nr:DUF3891 family protein [Rossellomorea vietnamensis]TYR99217.1 DUF3891 family protein [Rossellomorea vietnamensis]